MTSYALPYSPGELVRQCAQAPVPLHHKVAGLILRNAPQFMLDVIGQRLVAELDQIALRQSSMTLEFESLADRVNNAPEDKPIDDDDVLYAMLADLEDRLRKSGDELRATWQAFNPGAGRRRAAVRLAALRLADATQATIGAARNLRGAIQAHDANVCAMQQAMRVCRTPAELHATLDALQA